MESSPMNFWQKIQAIIAKIKEIGSASIRKIAEATGFSKSSVHRHLQAKERRNQYTESHLWETKEGMTWLLRLVVSTLLHLGIKRGVGVESISDFFKCLRINTHVGISPTALRRVQEELESLIMEYGKVHQEQGAKTCGPKEIVGGVDETFFEQMVLVMLDLSSGYLLLEEFSSERTTQTWKERVDKALASLQVRVRYLVSDRAKALIKLAVQHFWCRSIADLFHAMHDIAKGFSLAIQSRLNQAQKELQKANAALEKTPPQQTEQRIQQAGQMQQLQQRVREWESVQEEYRTLLHQFGQTVHPFSVVDGAPKTSAIVAQQLNGTIEQLEELAQTHNLLSSAKHLKPVKNLVDDLASLMTVWWDWVDHSLDDPTLDFLTKHWLKEVLLPKVYWECQLARCRSQGQRPVYQQALEQARKKLEEHPLSSQWERRQVVQWAQWAKTMVSRFQRTSSPVEGRNGYLSQINHSRRGLSTQRLRVLTILHDFELKRADGTTAAERFFETSFPDLFEWVLSRMADLPLPRQSRRLGAVAGL
jgi:AcrR family transcriptional regulator